MQAVSKYVKKDGRFETLESPYMELKMTGSKELNSLFKKFLVNLSKSDIKYEMLFNEGADKSTLNEIINSVSTELKLFINKIDSDEDLTSFIDVMEKVRDAGNFGQIIYNNCTINKLGKSSNTKEEIKDENEYNLLKTLIDYKILRCHNILVKDEFNDFKPLISDLSIYLEKIESYVKKENFPIDEIREYEDKIMGMLKDIREKFNDKDFSNKYINCKIITDNKTLEFKCNNLVSILLYKNEDIELSTFDNIISSIISSINNQTEFDAFINFMDDIKLSGQLGKKLYYYDKFSIDKLTYDEFIQINNQNTSSNIENKTYNIYEVIQMKNNILQVMNDYKVNFKSNMKIEDLNIILMMLYSTKKMLDYFDAPNATDEIIHAKEEIDNNIKEFEGKKNMLEEMNINMSKQIIK